MHSERGPCCAFQGGLEIRGDHIRVWKIKASPIIQCPEPLGLSRKLTPEQEESFPEPSRGLEGRVLCAAAPWGSGGAPEGGQRLPGNWLHSQEENQWGPGAEGDHRPIPKCHCHRTQGWGLCTSCGQGGQRGLERRRGGKRDREGQEEGEGRAGWGRGTTMVAAPRPSRAQGQPPGLSVPQQEDHLAVITPIKKTNGWNLSHIK